MSIFHLFARVAPSFNVGSFCLLFPLGLLVPFQVFDFETYIIWPLPYEELICAGIDTTSYLHVTPFCPGFFNLYIASFFPSGVHPSAHPGSGQSGPFTRPS